MHSTNLKVHGLRVRVKSGDEGFMRYVLANMYPFLDPEQSREEPDLSVEFTYLTQRRYVLEPAKEGRRAGADLWISHNQVMWRWRGLEILATQNNQDEEEERLVIESYFHETPIGIWSKSNPKKILGELRGHRNERRRTNHHFSARFVLHLPIMYLLAMKLGLALIHASSVQKQGIALVFTGLGACGKSTLATYLAENKGWEHVSDNFTLTDGSDLYAYPENPRIAPDSLAMIRTSRLTSPTSCIIDPKRIGKESQDKKKAGKVSGKHHLEPREYLPPRASIDRIYFLSLGEETQAWKITPQQSLERIRAINDYLGEFPEYTYLRFLPGNQGMLEKNYAKIERLLDKTEQYDLVQGSGNLEETSQIIQRGIRDADR